MRADVAASPGSTAAVLQAWQAEVAALGGRLVDLEADTTVTVARSGVLTGASAAAWSAADAGLAAAWDAYRRLGELVERALAEPGRATELLTAPGAAGGAGDASATLRAAEAAVTEAVAVAGRLAAAWGDLAARSQAAAQTAAEAGDAAARRAADALAGLLASDPLAVTEADVAAVEDRVRAAADRHAAARAAAGRFDVDLAAARTTLAGLDADVQAAAGELAHAASRIVGLGATVPVTDVAALGGWLDRIEALAATGRDQAAAALDDWVAAAAARRAELDAALAPARAGLRRREEGRGLWSALRAKAGARHLDERPDVVAALDAARDQLWRAPCDLDAADEALGRLAAALDDRGREGA
jgi:hypothetical protein